MKKLFLAVLFLSNISFAEPIGSIFLKSGDFKLKHSDGKEETNPKQGTVINEGDTITTTSGKIKIIMNDGGRSVVNVMQDSEIKFTETRATKEKAIEAKIFLQKGQLKSEVHKVQKSDVHFEVHSANGVLGVRGTKFIVNYDAKTDTTEEITIEGEVLARNRQSYLKSGGGLSQNLFKGTPVAAKHRTLIVGDKEPSDPEIVSDADLKKLDEDTTVTEEKPKSDSKKKSK